MLPLFFAPRLRFAGGRDDLTGEGIYGRRRSNEAKLAVGAVAETTMNLCGWCCLCVCFFPVLPFASNSFDLGRCLLWKACIHITVLFPLTRHEIYWMMNVNFHNPTIRWMDSMVVVLVDRTLDFFLVEIIGPQI